MNAYSRNLIVLWFILQQEKVHVEPHRHVSNLKHIQGLGLGPGMDIVGSSELIHSSLVKVAFRKVNGICFASYVFLLLPPSSTVNTGLSVYRDKNALSHFVTAGGKTFLFCLFFNLKNDLGNM